MFSARDTMLRPLLLGTALAAGRLATAGTTPPDMLDSFVWPPQYASVKDEIFALYADSCGRVAPDSARSHTIRRTEKGIEIDIYVVPPGTPYCPAVYLPDTLIAYPLGKLEPGFHTITRRILQRSESGSARLLRQHSIEYQVWERPHPAVSGSWYDPSQSGAGVFLNLLPDADGGEPGDRAFMYLMTHTGDGEALWLGGLGNVVESRIEVPMQPAGAADDGDDAAINAVFTYEGCGKATLVVDGAPTLLFPQGETQLQQLTRTGGVPPCSPPPRRPRWLE